MTEEKIQNLQTAVRELKVEIIYGDIKASFSGDAETVLHSVNSFIGKQIPAIDIARKISLSFTAEEMIQRFQDYVRVTPEGPRVFPGESRFSDKEAIALRLVAQIIAYDAGKAASPRLGSGELQELTGLVPKTLSSRLSELIKSGMVSKDAGESGPLFKLTTQGVAWLSTALEKK